MTGLYVRGMQHNYSRLLTLLKTLSLCITNTTVQTFIRNSTLTLMPLCISALLLQKEASDIIEIRCKDLKFVSVIYIAINAIS